MFDKNNTLKVAWYTAGKTGVAGLYRAESNDGGKSFSPRLLTFEGAVSGTPVFLADKGEDLDAVWESNGRLFRANARNNQNGFIEIGNGSAPSAVFAESKLFVAYVKKEGEKRSIWLTQV